MSTTKGAFEKDIGEDQVRIVLNITSIEVTINNAADAFVEIAKDKPLLKIETEGFEAEEIRDGFELKYDQASHSLNLHASIWFDVEMDEVSKVLNNPITFLVEGNQPDYITYFIDNINYRLEWLQFDKNKNEISTVSVTKKSYSQPIIESERQYTLAEIAKGAELLSKAIKKIDLRTGSAYVRLNTGDGEHDPILSIIAENMGYKISPLDKSTKEGLLKEGRRATHIISLQINF